MIDLLLSRGRIADRTSRAIPDTAHPAQALQGTAARTVGDHNRHADNDGRITPPHTYATLRDTGAGLDTAQVARVWLHVEGDALEPGFDPAAYAAPNRLLPEQLRAIRKCRDTSAIAGIELADLGDPEVVCS